MNTMGAKVLRLVSPDTVESLLIVAFDFAGVVHP